MPMHNCNHFRGPSGNKGTKRKKNVRVKHKHKSKYPSKFKKEIAEIPFIFLKTKGESK